MRVEKTIMGSLIFTPHNIIQVNKPRRMKWAGYVVCMGEWSGAYRVLVQKPEGKRPLGRPRCIWEDNIKMDLQEVGWGTWTGLMTQNRVRWQALVNAVINLQVS
jgi:hypothetical protein